MTKEQKESFLLYTEHKEIINELTDEQAGALFKKLFEYVSTGITPELCGMEKIAFISIRQDLDRNAEKYAHIVEQRKIAGKKGGQQRAINQANAIFAAKNQANQADNVNVNDNDNVLSLNEEKNNLDEEEKISDEEREILENYIKKNNLATKNIKAYASKIISNGDWKSIIETERKNGQLKKTKLSDKERIEMELASIHDKRSCARILANYYMRGSPPAEFDEVMEKYNLDTYSKMEQYAMELNNNKK